MINARILASIPFILGGQMISSIGYRIADCRHLNPHNRRTS